VTGERAPSAAVPVDTARARQGLRLCEDGPVYMNIGGAGPLPDAAGEAIERALRRGMREGRASLAAVMRMEAAAERLRRRASALVGGGRGEVGLTGNTTVGINIGLWGLAWHPGDEIITTSIEHPGVSVPVGVVARRHRVRVHHIPADEAAGDLEAAVAARATGRTRAVVLSHVAYGTGQVLDVAGACRAAARAGALRIVDGAQSVGAIPVDAPALGADVYAFPAHKWLYGPEGLGAVWVAPGVEERLDLSFSGYESGSGHTPDGGLTPHPGGRRYETSTPPNALLDGWAVAIAWLEGFGWDRVHARIGEGQAAAVAALAAIPGVRVLTPGGPQAGLVSFAIEGHDPVGAAARMVDEGVIVRWLEHPRALRASIGFHWCHTDIDRLAAAVRAVRGC
jgi:L-cysteine/cystine lyase